MNINAGSLLISTPTLDDPNFEKVVVFITEHNEKGALGFVVNKLFPRTFNELVEYKHSSVFPLYDGGPVEEEKLFFLHCRPDLIKDGVPVVDSIYMGGNFKQAVAHINDTNSKQNDIKLFIGYCGWDYNQLEEEIEEGSWLLCNMDKEIVFSANVEMLWKELYKECKL